MPRFEIVREIGQGAMGVVYLARQLDLRRPVALKQLPAALAGDAGFVDLFAHESHIGGFLSHANIVTVFEYFEHEDIPYISMEYLELGSLRPYVGGLSLPQIAGV